MSYQKGTKIRHKLRMAEQQHIRSTKNTQKRIDHNEINKRNIPYIEMDPPRDLKGRPIIAGPNSPTQHLSQLLDKIISHIVPHLKYDFI